MLDVSIAVLALALVGFSYQYFEENIILRYSLACLFAGISVYYASKLFEASPQQPVAAKVWGSNINAVIMLNETGSIMKQWNIQGKTTLLIGKHTRNKEVDIDLSDSAYDALIHDEHAVMNFAAGKWYIEGLHRPSSVSIKKASDQMRYRLTGSRPCQVEPGDIVYIANTRLMMK